MEGTAFTGKVFCRSGMNVGFDRKIVSASPALKLLTRTWSSVMGLNTSLSRKGRGWFQYFGLRTSVSALSLTHDSRVKGPAPTGFELRMALRSFPASHAGDATTERPPPPMEMMRGN